MRTSNEERIPWTTLALRGAVFTLFSAFLFSGCLVRQALELRQAPLPRWVMFGGAGLGLIQYRFERVEPSGARAPLDVYEVLELPRGDRAPGVWRVRGQEEITTLGHRLCTRLRATSGGQDELDLRVVTRKATREGWKRGRRGRRNICPRPGRRSP